MTAQVARMKRANVDAIAAIGLGKDLAVLRRTMARLNVNVPLAASNGALGQPYQEGAGELTLGTLGTMIGAFGNPMRAPAADFAKAYKAKYGTDRWWGNDPENPQLFMAISVSNGYDAANILFEGIRLANSTDPKAVIAAIESIKDYQASTRPTPSRRNATTASRPMGSRCSSTSRRATRSGSSRSRNNRRRVRPARGRAGPSHSARGMRVVWISLSR